MTTTGSESASGGSGALSPTLETRRLQLRIMTNEDHAPLYRLSSDLYDEFLRGLNLGVLCQFVVSPQGSQEVLGLVVAYDADFRHRFCRAAVVMHPRLHRRGLGLEAFLGLARYIYYGWDFRMIIMDTMGIAFDTFASGEQAGYFTVEGRIKDQFFYGGRYWDGISITHRREQFDTVMAGPMSRLVTPGQRVLPANRPAARPSRTP
jgi:hypothetical protein